MRIELDIFSGRPNPAWELGTSEVETIDAVLAGLPEPVPTSQPAHEPLGYRGFRIIAPEKGWTLTVHGTTVEIRSADGGGTATDAHARLEQALVEIARAHLEPDIYEFLQSQLHP
ncbi:hypothetical protein BTZ20_2914 [Rhodococcus sp. MTM3W5.2]|uniref:hypothetical protein n=1 Tax=Rhodococcus sp. MTM3W5.2 TaxID=1805827 RepID=UPI000979662B|nr:hypothetical protein [Rhodococcus sp. MTM3W5.2]AQA20673.1 hypothetical protein BTZ20_2914 [Rhodococcus sp. MTM3W5.2]